MATIVESCEIRVKTQGTQTVRIDTEAGVSRKYKKCFRIAKPSLDTKQMTKNVSGFLTIYVLEKWLINNQKAQYEPEK
jgi:hypothetical protein